MLPILKKKKKKNSEPSGVFSFITVAGVVGGSVYWGNC